MRNVLTFVPYHWSSLQRHTCRGRLLVPVIRLGNPTYLAESYVWNCSCSYYQFDAERSYPVDNGAIKEVKV